MSDSLRPHRWQPTRLCRPWDSPGKNTGVGCHFLLQCMKVKVKSFSRVRLVATPWTAAHQAPPSMGFSRQGAQYATGDQWLNNSRKNEEAEPKQKQYPVVDVTDDGSKVWCCKEQYCIGTWNVRSMNQGKLKVVQEMEMARVTISISGISELKWTEMVNLIQMTIIIYYCGQEFFGTNEVALLVNKSPKCSTWVQSQKWHNDLCFQGKPFNITVIQVYAPITNAKEAKVECSVWLTRPF